MNNKITSIIREVKTKLTWLGAILFYLYALLILLGGIGVTLGVFDLICKLLHRDIIQASFVELIALIIISCAMIKIFIRESTGLLSTQALNNEKINQENRFKDPKIIPFNRDFID